MSDEEKRLVSLFSTLISHILKWPKLKPTSKNTISWVEGKAGISGYVPVDATQQTDQRTSQMVYLFFAEALISTEHIHKYAPADVSCLI